MIIISQDRDKIINFNNIVRIERINEKIEVTDEVYPEAAQIIGRYKTEERAKKIIKDIINAYQINELIKIIRDVSLQDETFKILAKENIQFGILYMPKE